MGWICWRGGRDCDSMYYNDSRKTALLEDFLWSDGELKRYLLNRKSKGKRLRINKNITEILFIRKFVFSASISSF